MSIESKHAYRFNYLKSEAWSNVRIEALAREGGKCQICYVESISNDAHHMWYPESIWETRAEQLVILCRPCHDFVHAMIPECKTNSEDEGRAYWSRFYGSIIAWRTSKLLLFGDANGLKIAGPKELRAALENAKQELKKKKVCSGDAVEKNEVLALLKNINRKVSDFITAIEKP